MAENSGIGWTTHTNNFWWGCHKVSEECRFCYIDRMMNRVGIEAFKGPIKTKAGWKNHARWNKECAKSGDRYRIFTCSMSDFLHRGADEWRAEAWAAIKSTPNLDWLILTKRADDIEACLPEDWGHGYPNVWLGVTIGKQDSMWRLDYLKKVPARIKFVSAEPLLEAIDFGGNLKGINWVISGCESGAVDKRRPMEMSWIESIDTQCNEAGTAHFFKQYYAGSELVKDGMLNGKVVQNFPTADMLCPRCGGVLVFRGGIYICETCQRQWP